MKSILLMLGLAGLALAGPAAADCSDTARPNAIWRRCVFDGRDFTGVKLPDSMLRDSTFVRSVLKGADLSGSDAYRAKFVSVEAVGAVFDRSRLIAADFTRADLTESSFKEADLRDAIFANAVLVRANFSGARLAGVDFRNADLSGAIWTDGTRVCGEHSIGQCH